MLFQTKFGQWIEDCFKGEECLQSKYRFRNAIIDIVLIHEIINRRNILDHFTDTNLQNQDSKNYEILKQFDEKSQQESVLLIWATLNGGLENVKHGDGMFNYLSLEGNDTDINLTEEQKQWFNELFSEPKIHGNRQKDFVLVPYCSFGSSNLKECDLFKKAKLDIGQNRCFTFNGNPKTNKKGDRVGPNNGLYFTTGFRMPSTYSNHNKKALSPLKIILHEPGSAVDNHYRMDTFLEIKPGKNYVIGTDATILETTDTFKDMSDSKRNCHQQSNNDPYHQSNCYFNQLIKEGIEHFKCIPWYMHHMNTSTKICVNEDFVQFERMISNETVQQKVLKVCLPSCSFIKYAPNVMMEETLKAEDMEDEIFYDVLGTFMGGIEEQETNPYLSKIQVNFAEPYATVVTQDAKVTFADMLGTIGGTFGVFLGLSFVSLADEMVEILQNIYSKLSFKKVVSSTLARGSQRRRCISTSY